MQRICSARTGAELFAVLGLPPGNPPLQGSFTRRFDGRTSTNGLPVLVINPRLIGVSPEKHFVDPRPVNALGLDFSLHLGIIEPKRDRTIELSTVKVMRGTRASSRMSCTGMTGETYLRKRDLVIYRMRQFPFELRCFVRIFWTRPSAGDLDGAIADCGDVGEAHPREPLEQGRWSELCGDFRVLHPRIVGLKFVRTIALSHAKLTRGASGKNITVAL